MNVLYGLDSRNLCDVDRFQFLQCQILPPKLKIAMSTMRESPLLSNGIPDKPLLSASDQLYHVKCVIVETPTPVSNGLDVKAYARRDDMTSRTDQILNEKTTPPHFSNSEQ